MNGLAKHFLLVAARISDHRDPAIGDKCVPLDKPFQFRQQEIIERTHAYKEN